LDTEKASALASGLTGGSADIAAGKAILGFMLSSHLP
tara:strand:- start:36927 stop:37037 length:111 start_codon:yes stop_codon:yes gene_type:complete